MAAAAAAPEVDPKDYQWLPDARVWVCVRCVTHAAHIVGAPVTEFHMPDAELTPTQHADMQVHAEYHRLNGHPPKYRDFVLRRQRVLRGDAFVYTCCHCDWTVGVNVMHYDKCYLALKSLNARIAEHTATHNAIRSKK